MTGSGDAPNAKPGPPDLLTQMGGEPSGVVVKKKGPSTKPRSGDEGRAKPPIEELTPRDRVATTAHLASTVTEAGKHARVHAKEAKAQAKKLKGPLASTLKHNTAHADKHVDEMVDHAQKLQDHLDKLPGVKGAVDELHEPRPSREPKGKK